MIRKILWIFRIPKLNESSMWIRNLMTTPHVWDLPWWNTLSTISNLSTCLNLLQGKISTSRTDPDYISICVNIRSSDDNKLRDIQTNYFAACYGSGKRSTCGALMKLSAMCEQYNTSCKRDAWGVMNPAQCRQGNDSCLCHSMVYSPIVCPSLDEILPWNRFPPDYIFLHDF